MTPYIMIVDILYVEVWLINGEYLLVVVAHVKKEISVTVVWSLVHPGHVLYFEWPQQLFVYGIN